MDLSLVTDWLNLIFRWLHLIFGAAWIGTSFYFNWLNNHVRPPEDPAREEAGVKGTLWSVHGGAFYKVTKFAVAPEKLPKTLHWFKWEAYLTWITGASLLTVVYYLQADAFMVDRSVADLPTLAVVGIGVGALLGGWTLYHLLCKSPLGKKPVPFALVAFALATAAAFGLSQVMSPRAAYIHMGAILGTCMAWNVFFVIIPNQRRMVDAMIAGQDPDPEEGRAAALRSLHNNYMTLPVLFIMVSNHFPMTYGHTFNWAILAALSLIGAATRHYFNLKGQGHKNVYILPAAAAATLALAFVSSPNLFQEQADNTPVTFAQAQTIIDQRCTPCHSANPTHELYPKAPAGVMFDTADQIKTQVPKINLMAVKSQTMPLGNLTHMTDDERALLGAWIRQGAPTQDPPAAP